MKAWFYRIGSDPEFLFVDRQEFRPTIYAANSVITAGRAVALNTFIGTDNHQTTAEMRPGPAHNIGRHLYDIAYGLHETDKWLAGHKRYNTLKMTAQPVVLDEPLGGHIHCSLFVDEPLTKFAMSTNRVYKNDRLVAYDPTQPTTPLTSDATEKLTKYAKLAYDHQLLTGEVFGQVMDHLCWPFECAVQPWWDRVRRNGRYGALAGTGEKVRQNASYPQNASKYKDLAYLHYEYRSPSTWLVHPWLAYAYLALGKLSILNLSLILEQLGKPKLPKLTTSPMNDELREIFNRRLQVIKTKGRWSRDIRDLEQVVDACFANRAAWFEIPGQPIDIDAWRRLL
mgnify:FL=1